MTAPREMTGCNNVLSCWCPLINSMTWHMQILLASAVKLVLLYIGSAVAQSAADILFLVSAHH
jgi:hypothetical protein